MPVLVPKVGDRVRNPRHGIGVVSRVRVSPTRQEIRALEAGNGNIRESPWMREMETTCSLVPGLLITVLFESQVRRSFALRQCRWTRESREWSVRSDRSPRADQTNSPQ